MFPSRTISLAINWPWAELYAFLSNPQTINRWTQGLFPTPLSPVTDHTWRTLYDGEEVIIAFTPANPFGVLDVELIWTDKPPRHYVARLFPNGEASELCCTIIQRPGESDAAFASECEWVRIDLDILKTYIESL
ncbi:hypothetical protein [Devosia lucknowensis]|nr:hypothetical protein [Devosia lucknowensis]